MKKIKPKSKNLADMFFDLVVEYGFTPLPTHRRYWVKKGKEMSKELWEQERELMIEAFENIEELKKEFGYLWYVKSSKYPHPYIFDNAQIREWLEEKRKERVIKKIKLKEGEYFKELISPLINAIKTENTEEVLRYGKGRDPKMFWFTCIKAYSLAGKGSKKREDWFRKLRNKFKDG